MLPLKSNTGFAFLYTGCRLILRLLSAHLHLVPLPISNEKKITLCSV